MKIPLLSVCFILVFPPGSNGWLAPERCAQSKRLKRTSKEAFIIARSVPSIQDLMEQQNARLKETYKLYEFRGVPISGQCSEDLNTITLNVPHNCSFHTYEPRLLSSVSCVGGAGCKLAHTVATVDTYQASEGYNWGVKFSAKASFFDLFEAGGEASTGGTYSCAYTKGKTTTELVECTAPAGRTGHLHLYHVKTDMACDFGNVILEKEKRGKSPSDLCHLSEFTAVEQFTFNIIRLGIDYKCLSPVRFFYDSMMLDPSLIPEDLLAKIMKKFPLYNPYTDVFVISDIFKFIGVAFYKEIRAEKATRRIIPFTNKHGDSEYQYACIFTPS